MSANTPFPSRRAAIAAALLLAAASLGGCADVSDGMRVMLGGGVDFVQPPEQAAMSGHRRLTLADAGRPDDAALRDALSGALAAARVDGRAYYEVTTVSSPEVLALRVRDAHAESADTFEREPRRVCPDRKDECRDDAKVRVTVSCLRREARAVATVDGVDAAGTLVLHDTAEGTASARLCRGDVGTMPDADALKDQARQDLRDKLFAPLLPTTDRKPLDLTRTLDGADPATADALQRAFTQAAGGDVAGALAAYQALQAQGRDPHGAVSFDAGYCQQALGRYRAADAAYRVALSRGAADVVPLAKYQAENATWLARGIDQLAR